MAINRCFAKIQCFGFKLCIHIYFNAISPPKSTIVASCQIQLRNSFFLLLAPRNLRSCLDPKPTADPLVLAQTIDQHSHAS